MIKISSLFLVYLARYRAIEIQDKTQNGDNQFHKVKVYVYDDPVFDNTDLIECYRQVTGVVPWLHERFDMVQNLGDIWLHRSLISHPWRVNDPEDADVFFVPIYPFLSFHLMEWKYRECNVSHWERMASAIMYLNRKSTYFKRYGGADHAIICTWWNCKQALGRWHRMILRRAIIGVLEGVDHWTEWGCLGRNVTVPYVASSTLTTPKVLGGVESHARRVPFFFAGTTRHRQERINLKVSTIHKLLEYVYGVLQLPCTSDYYHIE